MALRNMYEKALAWTVRNERRLGGTLFAMGFVTDVFTFGFLPIRYVNLFFLTYLVLAALCTFGTHSIPEDKANESWPKWKRTLAVFFPLAVQYMLGGVLSGMVVFYAKNSAPTVSWPFIALIFIAYISSEYFRKYKDYLLFQTVLLFLALYAYAIFALPLLVGTIGPWVFALSSAIACAVFALFLVGLRVFNRARYLESRKRIIISGIAIIVLVNAAYFTGIIPPVPLALADSGVYHTLAKVPGGYEAQEEVPRPWWDIRTQVIHHVPGTSLFAYSAVQAPIAFSSSVVHRWEYFSHGAWITKSIVSFSISGGRAGGYRGYSEHDDLAPGKWRVSVETPGGQVIGRITFIVEDATSEPSLESVTL